MRKIFYKLMILSIILMIFPLKANAFDDKAHFPPTLTNDARKKAPDTDLPVKKSKVLFGSGQKKLYGILVCPADAGTKQGENIISYPGILFLQTNDEAPEKWVQRMSDLAGKGYSVMAVNYKNGADTDEALTNFLKLDVVNKAFVGVLGVHQGYPEAVILGIRKPKEVKCVVCVSGKPPYNIPGGDPAASIFCPVMLIHGNIDEQVPVSVSQYFFESLKHNDKTAKIFFMPNSRHYFNDAEWARIQLEFVKFLNVYLKGIPDPEGDKSEKPENAP
ncbi:MAG: prolyl oligopeptidase family serine peptidase [Firmicutes bacterium]|nr:prolyl oligopeptidase family serine peptidase [Bacillota bacterium]